jgi:hypothetical protein
MKTIKFRGHLVPAIIAGEKTATWRLFDDKNLSVGDELSLVEFGDEAPFAEAVISEVTEKPLGELTVEDKVGHEYYESDEAMYAQFSTYYNQPIDAQTNVKIVRFQLR